MPVYEKSDLSDLCEINGKESKYSAKRVNCSYNNFNKGSP